MARRALDSKQLEVLKRQGFQKGYDPKRNYSGRPLKKPITDRYLQALEVQLPDEIRKGLKLAKGAKLGDAIAMGMAYRAISGNKAVEAAKEMREAIEGKAPVSPEPRDLTPIDIRVVYEGTDGAKVGVAVQPKKETS